MQSNARFIFLLFLLMAAACAGPEHSASKPDSHRLRVSFYGGMNQGGIVENTNMSIIPGAGPDAFTGATRPGFHAGGGAELPIGNVFVESSVDVMNNHQTFTFDDPVNLFSGTRSIGLWQLTVPLRVGGGFFTGRQPGGLLRVSGGPALQLNMFSVNDEGSRLPDFQTRRWAAGINLRLSVVPFRFANGSTMGIYLDGYRGSRIYEDFYNRPEHEIPGSSFLKIGLLYQLPGF